MSCNCPHTSPWNLPSSSFTCLARRRTSKIHGSRSVNPAGHLVISCTSETKVGCAGAGSASAVSSCEVVFFFVASKLARPSNTVRSTEMTRLGGRSGFRNAQCLLQGTGSPCLARHTVQNPKPEPRSCIKLRTPRSHFRIRSRRGRNRLPKAPGARNPVSSRPSRHPNPPAAHLQGPKPRAPGVREAQGQKHTELSWGSWECH